MNYSGSCELFVFLLLISSLISSSWLWDIYSYCDNTKDEIREKHYAFVPPDCMDPSTSARISDSGYPIVVNALVSSCVSGAWMASLSCNVTEPSAPIDALHINKRGGTMPVNGNRSPLAWTWTKTNMYYCIYVHLQ